MTELTLSAWLAELVDALSAGTSPPGTSPPDVESQELDELLDRGLALEFMSGDTVTEELMRAAMVALRDARAVVGQEIAAVHRERIDVDRTVKAITAYVKALN